MNRVIRALRSPALLRLLFNFYPPYLMTGIVVHEISRDCRRVVVRMGLHWYNRNYFGTHFGASLYAMADPFYVIMLSRNIGSDYVVWDRAAEIEFLRPGRGRVTAVFELTPGMVREVLEAVATGGKCQPTWPVEVRDEAGEVVARVTKTLYVRRKSGR
jgi:acyl-coenzyme A thioesterase PaaI-like protein